MTAPVLLLTPRDRDVLRDVYRFGCLSAVQLALRHWPDSASDKTARNRLWQLCEAGYLVRRPIGHREDGAYLLTPEGQGGAGAAHQARPAGPARLRARCATASSWPTSPTGSSPGATAAGSPSGSPRWTSTTAGSGSPGGRPGPGATARGAGRAAGARTGCWCSEAGERVWRLAVEVELHQKASRLYDAKLAWYAVQFAAGALDGLPVAVRRRRAGRADPGRRPAGGPGLRRPGGGGAAPGGRDPLLRAARRDAAHADRAGVARQAGQTSSRTSSPRTSSRAHPALSASLRTANTTAGTASPRAA